MLNGLPLRSIVRVVSEASIISPLNSFPFFCLTKSFSFVLIPCTAAQLFDEAGCCERASGTWLKRNSKTSDNYSGFMLFSLREHLQPMFLRLLVRNRDINV